MINTLYLPELREMLSKDDSVELREFCAALHPASTAEFMEGLSPDETWKVLRHADSVARTEIFNYLDLEKQIEIVEHQDRQEVASLVAELAADDRVDLLKDVESKTSSAILELLPVSDRREILRLTAYPEGTAGAVMTTEVAKLDEELTIAEALEHLSRQQEGLETIYYLYIVDQGDRLRGLVSARQLISTLSRRDVLMRDLMETELVTVDADEDQEEVARKVARYDLLAIPVVDDSHRMLGIITHDDVIDVVREEAVEDAHRIAAVEPLEESYFQTDLLTMSWSRGIWLAILFFGALLTASALAYYNQQLEIWPWLVYFVPLVISSGGNTGNQSATLIITAMTTGDVKISDSWRVILREVQIGLILGAFLAVCFLAIGWIWPELRNIRAAMVLPITLLLIVFSGALIGSILPLLFKRMGLDPALMSNPFVAGIIDILGIVVYLQVAMLLLPVPASP